MASDDKRKDKDMQRLNRLEEENKRLRDEVRSLRSELDRKNGTSAASVSSLLPRREKAYQILVRHSAERERLFSRKNFASYLFGSFKSHSFYLYYQRLVFWIRKYTFITTTVKLLAFIFALIQSSALFVLFTGTVAITAPLTAIFSYVALMLSFFGRKKLNKRINLLLDGKRITVFFPPKERAFEKGSYFHNLVSETAEKDGHVAVIVSPYYFSGKGFSDSKRYYLACRRESENVIIIRKHYYFSFKKKVLEKHRDNTTLIF